MAASVRKDLAAILEDRRTTTRVLCFAGCEPNQQGVSRKEPRGSWPRVTQPSKELQLENCLPILAFKLQLELA